MDIVLISPDSGGRNRLMAPIPPYSLASLAAVAKVRGHAVEVWDAFSTREDAGSLVARLISRRPDIIGISCLTPAEPAARRIIEGYRAGGGQGRTVLGSVHPTIFHREMMKQNACDIIVRREGEGVFDDLLAALETGAPLTGVKGITFREGGEVVATDDRDLVPDIDKLPIPAWETVEGGIDLYREVPTLGIYGLTLPILASRGCPFRCNFCGQEIFHKGFRKRTVQNVIGEIRVLSERFGMKNFVFLDANFPTSKRHGFEFCDALIESGLAGKTGWSTEIAVNLVDGELIRRMAEAGCRNIEYGFEVGSQEILDTTGKHTTIAQAAEAMRHTRAAGIHTLGLFMIGLPGERPSHFMKTLSLAMKLDCDIAKFNIAIPYPGSELFEHNREKLLADFDPETYNPWFQSSDPGRKLTVVPGGLSAERLLFWQRIMMFLYYARPGILLRHLRNRSLSGRDILTGARFLVGGLWESFRNSVLALPRLLRGRADHGAGRS